MSNAHAFGKTSSSKLAIRLSVSADELRCRPLPPPLKILILASLTDVKLKHWPTLALVFEGDTSYSSGSDVVLRLRHGMARRSTLARQSCRRGIAIVECDCGR